MHKALHSLKAHQRHGRRSAFTLVETAIAALISSMLLMTMAGIWQNLGRSVNLCINEAKLSSEARILLEVLRQDFAGMLAEAQLGAPNEGTLVGRLVSSGELRLCYDMEPLNETAEWASPDYVVVYEVANGQLLRTLNNGEPFVVANHVKAFEPRIKPNEVEIDVELEVDGSSKELQVVAHND